jgi:hypothetical protein
MAKSTFVYVTYPHHAGDAVVNADRRGVHEAVLVRRSP